MTTWPHAPSKLVGVPGTYIITSGTYQKQPFFRSREELDHLQEHIFAACEEFQFQLQAWSVFANHYHLVGFTASDGVRSLTKAIHGRTSLSINKLHSTPGRQVWYRTWDSLLTYERSYLARLHYVHENPVHHNLARQSCDYRWCSAKWFEDQADRSFVNTVRSFPIDNLNVVDDF
jgi:putative transposase